MSVLQLPQLHDKLHPLLHMGRGKVRGPGGSIEEPSPIGGHCQLPVIVIHAELVQHPIAIPILGDLGADIVKILPGPVIPGHLDAFPFQQGLVHEHQGGGALHRQGVKAAILPAVCQRRSVEARLVEALIPRCEV